MISVFVNERILNSEIPIPALGAVNSNLCPLRLART